MGRRFAALALLALTASGCGVGGHRAAGPAPLRGYADMEVLVRRHPGWGGVAQYDEALARLAAASGRTPQAAPDVAGLAALPRADGDVPAAPELALQQEGRRLQGVERAQIARLRDRQARNRQRQLSLKRSQWEADAAKIYATDAGDAQTAYARRMSALAVDEDAKRLNLTLQIQALTKIVTGWDKSKPPTPELNQARTDLAQKQDALVTLTASRRQAEAQALADRDEAVRAAARKRDLTVSGQVAEETAALTVQDDKDAATLTRQLGVQRDALLRETRLLSAAPVSAVGPLGALRLPTETPLATAAPGAAHSFRLAAAQLQEQRRRWVAFLYSDTRAAAQDAARQKHWVVTYGRPVPGERDLTEPLARALTARVWKT